MNIWFIASWWPTRVHPRNGNFVEKHARLVAREHDLTVVSVEEDPGMPPGKKPELDEQFTDGYRRIVGYYRPPSLLGQKGKLAMRAWAYHRVLRRARTVVGIPDLVHGHVLVDGGIVAAMLARRWRRPTVITEHASRYHSDVPLSPLRRRLARWAVRQAFLVLPVTDHLGQSMRERHQLYGSYQTVSNVVDIQQFYPPRQRQRPGRPFRLLHVSNFTTPVKHVNRLLAVYRRLIEKFPGRFQLHVAGDGDLDELNKWVAGAGLSAPDVSISGPHTEGEVAEIMRRADAFVLFSLLENQPVVLLEALCSGLPCVAPRVGGIPTLIQDGWSGTLITPRDEDELLVALSNLPTQVWNASLISEEAGGRFSERAVLEMLQTIYGNAVAEARS